MHIKKNDNVIVLTGKEKGKTAKVLRVFPERGKVLLESLFMATLHLKPSKERTKGQIVKRETPVHASNVMVVCSGCAKPSRFGVKKDESGNKSRVCKKCNASV